MAALVRAGKGVKEALAAPSAAAAAEPTPAETPTISLPRLITAMSRELRAAGLSDDQSDAAAFRILRTVFEDPQGARSFIDQLTTTSQA